MPLDKEYKNKYEIIFKKVLHNAQSGYYDEAALPSYTHTNRMMSWLFWQRIKTAVTLAGPLNMKTVLDFGAGGGITFAYLKECACQITAGENEFADLTQWVADHLNVDVEIVIDILKYSGKQYDVIFALDVLEHINDLNPYIDKFVELLNPHGIIVVSGPTENWLYKIGRKMAGFSGHYHVGNIYHIEEAFNQGGLEKIRLKKLYPVFTLFRISVWKKKQS